MSELKDPRVFFAAERTLLAWNRTSLTLMAFGFMIERFGLFLRMFTPGQPHTPRGSPSFWIGLAFLVLGAVSGAVAAIQYRKVLKTLNPSEIPDGYRCNLGVVTNLAVTLLGLALAAYLFVGARL